MHPSGQLSKVFLLMPDRSQQCRGLTPIACFVTIHAVPGETGAVPAAPHGKRVGPTGERRVLARQGRRVKCRPGVEGVIPVGAKGKGAVPREKSLSPG